MERKTTSRLWVQIVLLLLSIQDSSFGYLAPLISPKICRSSMPSFASRPRRQFVYRPIAATSRIYDTTDTAEETDVEFPSRRRIHEQVRKADPEWYRTYVVDILGQDALESKWPAVLEYSLNSSSSEYVGNEHATMTTRKTSDDDSQNDVSTQTSIELGNRENDGFTGDSPSPTPAINTTDGTYTAATSTAIETDTKSKTPFQADPSSESTGRTMTLLEDSDSSNFTNRMLSDPDFSSLETKPPETNSSIVSVNPDRTPVDDVTETMRSTPLENNLDLIVDSKEVKTSEKTTNPVSRPSSEKATNNANATSDNVVVAEVNAETDELRDLSTREGDNGPVVLGTSISELNESKTKSRINEINADGLVESPKKSQNQMKVAAAQYRSTAPANRVLDDDQISPLPASEVVVFRDSKNGWKTVKMNALEDLGYTREEVKELQPDALSIIVQEQIRRPRTLGLPSAWTLAPGKTQPLNDLKKTVQIVKNREEAMDFIQCKKSEKPVFQQDERRATASGSRGEDTRSPTSGARKSPKAIGQESAETSKQHMNGEAEISETPAVPILNKLGERSELLNETANEREDKAKSESGSRKIFDPLLKGAMNAGERGTSDSIFNSSTTVPSDFAPNSETTPKSSTFEVNKTEASIDKRIVLYRDLQNSLTMVPVANLTRLGYEVDEIRALQSEALAIIVEDQINRPASGIPPQWKVKGLGSIDVELVESMAKAEERCESEQTERIRRRAVETESARSRRRAREEVPLDPEKSQYPRDTFAEDTLVTPARKRDRGSRDRQGIRSKGIETGKKRRETDREKDVSSRRSDSPMEQNNPRQPPNSAEDDYAGERRRRPRSRENQEGSAKRIYNARELHNRGVKNALPDPPDPNSPIWIDMDNFRDLLRTEAQLRLSILNMVANEDWAPVVKRESEWRLNLYKNWLWTLHDGLGESIVPPSRYERARRVRVARQREEEALPDLPSRAKKPQTRRSRKKRPRD